MANINPHHLEILSRDHALHMANIASWLDQICESPIELALAVAMAHRASTTGDLFDIALRREPSASRTFARIFAQKTIEQWRVDFWVEFREVDRAIVIECDGHDWHERTPEQAARDKGRDRYFAERGIPVMRFTGREIWRDPLACADQVVNAIINIYTDWQIENLKTEQERDG